MKHKLNKWEITEKMMLGEGTKHILYISDTMSKEDIRNLFKEKYVIQHRYGTAYREFFVRLLETINPETGEVKRYYPEKNKRWIIKNEEDYNSFIEMIAEKDELSNGKKLSSITFNTFWLISKRFIHQEIKEFMAFYYNENNKLVLDKKPGWNPDYFINYERNPYSNEWEESTRI